MSGENPKPRCQKNTDTCSGFTGDVKECPIDNIPAASIASGANGLTCAGLKTCSDCLKFTYQCRWCVSGEFGGCRDEREMWQIK